MPTQLVVPDQEIENVHVQRDCEPFQSIDRNVRNAALQLRNVSAVKICQFGHLLLAQAAFPT